jgi:hypothetical protein
LLAQEDIHGSQHIQYDESTLSHSILQPPIRPTSFICRSAALQNDGTEHCEPQFNKNKLTFTARVNELEEPEDHENEHADFLDGPAQDDSGLAAFAVSNLYFTHNKF